MCELFTSDTPILRYADTAFDPIPFIPFIPVGNDLLFFAKQIREIGDQRILNGAGTKVRINMTKAI